MSKNNKKNIDRVDRIDLDPNWSNLSTEEQNLLLEKEQNKDLADASAKELGFNDMKDAQRTLTARIEHPEDFVNDKENLTASQVAATAASIKSRALTQTDMLVSSLLRKCYYMEIEESPYFSYMGFVDMFDDEPLEWGNTKEYVFDLATGISSYDVEYIPSRPVVAQVNKYYINMYSGVDASGQLQLADTAYQFKKRLSINQALWYPFFSAGKMDEFIEAERRKLRKTYRYFKFDNIVGRIAATARYLAHSTSAVEGLNPQYGRLVRGKEKDLFTSIANEVYPLLNDLKTGDANAWYGGEDYKGCIVETNPSDVLLLWNNKIDASVKAGVSSQLYNAQLFDLKKYLNEENVKIVGNRLLIPGANQWWVDNVDNPTQITRTLTAGNENNIITKSDLPYIPVDVIVLLNKNFIRHLYQILREGNQYYVNNLYNEYVLHVWATADFLPWLQFIVYQNANLAVLPNSEAEVTEG